MSERPDNRDDKGSAHAKVYIGVFVSMLLIIGLWMILLPGQIKITASQQGDDPSRWSSFKEDTSTSFEDALQELRAGLEDLEQEAQEGDAAAEEETQSRASLPVLEQRSGMEERVELLRARLEASQQNEN